MAGSLRLGTAAEARIVEAPIVDGPRVDGPFSVGVLFVRDVAGRLACVLAAKATFRLLPDECAVEPEPEPVFRVDQLAAPAGAQSPLTRVVTRPRDLVPVRYAPEVVVVGSAYSVGGQTDHVLARVAIADVDLAVEAWGERAYLPDGSLETRLGSRFPLDLSRSAGGPGTDNPVGVDPSGVGARGRRVLPGVLPPLFVPAGPGAFVPFASLGPVAPEAPLRSARLRDEDRRWLRAPHASPEPAGLDPRFFQAAPQALWAGRPFVADEWMVLEGLHPRLSRLATRLPGVAPSVTVDGHEVPVAAELLVLDSDAGTVTLTWRGGFLVEGRKTVRIAVRSSDDGEATADHEPTRDIGGEELDDVLAGGVPRPWPAESFGSAGVEGAPPPRPSGSALPFTESAPPPRPSRPSSTDGALPFHPGRRAGGRPGVVAPPLVGAPSPTAAAPASLAAASDQALASASWGEPEAEPKTGPLPVVRPQGFETVCAPNVGGPIVSNAAAPAALGYTSAGPPPAEHRPVRSQETPARPVAPEPPRSAPFGVAFGLLREAREDGNPPPQRADVGAPSAREASDRAARGGARPASRPGPTALPRLRSVDLWGFEPALVARLRRPPFAVWLKGPPPAGPLRVDDPATEPTADERARLDVLRALSFADATDLADARRLSIESLDDAVELEPPLVLLVGEARATFDEVETLRATVAAALPLAPGDKKLAHAVALAQEVLGGATPPTAELALGLARPIEQAALGLGLPAKHLERQVERALLEHRKLRRRTLFGAPRVRVDLVLGGEALPCYLEETWAPRWPLLSTVALVVLAELRPREDASEAAADALLVRAAARVLQSRG